MGVFGNNIENIPWKSWLAGEEVFLDNTQLNNEESKCLLKAVTFRFANDNSKDSIIGVVCYQLLTQLRGIVISDKTPTYENKGRDGGDTRILGEYDPTHRTITLYILSIRAMASNENSSSNNLLIYVFAHEMYHAFFHESNPSGVNNPYIEEPLAEYGALLFSCAFLEPSKFEGILSFVEDKQDGLPHYALGATLFKKVDLPSSVVIPYLNVRDKSFSGKSEQVVEYVNMVKQGELLCARDTLLNLLK